MAGTAGGASHVSEKYRYDSRRCKFTAIIILAVASLHSFRAMLTAPAETYFQAATTTASKNSTNNKPVAVIHIGPRKTGSTTIQTLLCDDEETARCLKEDSFVYVGKYKNRPPRKYVLECFTRGIDCEENKDEWMNFSGALEKLSLLNTNIIYSEEALMRISDYGLLLLQQALVGFRVRVIVAYRRYNEWVLSEHNQKARDMINQTNFKQTIAPFPSWLRKQLGRSPDKTFMPISRERVKDWKRFFPDIEIFNIHDQRTPMMERFICNHMMPEAQATCAAAKAGLLSSGFGTKYNLSNKTVDAILMYPAAIAANFTHDQALTLAAAVNNSNMTSSLPLLCPTKDALEEILNISLQRERDLVPAFFAFEKGENDIRETFAKDVKEKKYCNVNIQEFLKSHAHDILHHDQL